MTGPGPGGDIEGLIFDVDTFAVHDGPGIRMAVYLKGCPLTCAWCHSPESQSPHPEVIHLSNRCTLCGTCGAVCENDACEATEAGYDIDRAKCVVCGRCVEHCPSGALAITGVSAGAGAIVARAVRMKPFFDHSGGGVTLTGGEATSQIDFAVAVLAGCRAEDIHTAVETCGACDWNRLAALVEHCDLVMYDLKLIDDAEHCRWCGAPNEQVLDNARRLAASHANVEVRIALIPGITDSEANLAGIFAFMREAGLSRMRLLPYNPSAGAKYEWLGRAYEIAGQAQDTERLAALAEMGAAAGLTAGVG